MLPLQVLASALVEARALARVARAPSEACLSVEAVASRQAPCEASRALASAALEARLEAEAPLGRLLCCSSCSDIFYMFSKNYSSARLTLSYVDR
jgi:hypothetical protein